MFATKGEKIFDKQDPNHPDCTPPPPDARRSDHRLKRFDSTHDKRAWDHWEEIRGRHFRAMMSGSQVCIGDASDPSHKYVPLEDLINIIMAQKDEKIKELEDKLRRCKPQDKRKGSRESDGEKSGKSPQSVEGLIAERDKTRSMLREAMHKLQNIDSIVNENKALQNKLRCSEERIKVLEEKKKKLESELAELRSKSQIQVDLEKAQRMLEDVDKKQEDAVGMEETVLHNLSLERDELQDKVRMLERELEESRKKEEEIEMLKKKSESDSLDREEIARENECYRKKLASMKSLEQQIQELKKQGRALADKYRKDAQRSNDQLNKMSQCAKELQSLRDERDALRKRVNELAPLESQLHKLQKKLQRVDAVLAENEKLNSKLAELQKLEKENEDLKNKLAALQELEMNAAEDKERIMQLQCAVADQEEEMKDLLCQIEKLTNGKTDEELERLKCELYEKDSKLRLCEEQLAEIPMLEAEIDELRTKLQTCCKEFPEMKKSESRYQRMEVRFPAASKGISANYKTPGETYSTRSRSPCRALKEEEAAPVTNASTDCKEPMSCEEVQSLLQRSKRIICCVLEDMNKHQEEMEELERRNKDMKEEIEMLKAIIIESGNESMLKKMYDLKKDIDAKDREVSRLLKNAGNENDIKTIKELNEALKSELKAGPRPRSQREFDREKCKDLLSKQKPTDSEDTKSIEGMSDPECCKYLQKKTEDQKLQIKALNKLMDQLKEENKLLRELQKPCPDFSKELDEKCALENLLSLLQAELDAFKGQKLSDECEALRNELKRVMEQNCQLKALVNCYRERLDLEKLTTELDKLRRPEEEAPTATPSEVLRKAPRPGEEKAPGEEEEKPPGEEEEKPPGEEEEKPLGEEEGKPPGEEEEAVRKRKKPKEGVPESEVSPSKSELSEVRDFESPFKSKTPAYPSTDGLVKPTEVKPEKSEEGPVSIDSKTGEPKVRRKPKPESEESEEGPISIDSKTGEPKVRRKPKPESEESEEGPISIDSKTGEPKVRRKPKPEGKESEKSGEESEGPEGERKPKPKKKGKEEGVEESEDEEKPGAKKAKPGELSEPEDETKPGEKKPKGEKGGEPEGEEEPTPEELAKAKGLAGPEEEGKPEGKQKPDDEKERKEKKPTPEELGLAKALAEAQEGKPEDKQKPEDKEKPEDEKEPKDKKTTPEELAKAKGLAGPEEEGKPEDKQKPEGEKEPTEKKPAPEELAKAKGLAQPGEEKPEDKKTPEDKAKPEEKPEGKAKPEDLAKPTDQDSKAAPIGQAGAAPVGQAGAAPVGQAGAAPVGQAGAAPVGQGAAAPLAGAEPEEPGAPGKKPEDEIQALKDEIKRLQKENEDLRKQLEQKSQEHKSSMTEPMADAPAAAELEKLRQENEQLKNQLAAAQPGADAQAGKAAAGMAGAPDDLSKEVAKLENLIAKMEAENADKIKKLQDQHEKELAEREKAYNDNLNAVKGGYEADVKKMADRHKASVMRLQELHEDEVKEINSTHETQMGAMQSETQGALMDVAKGSAAKLKKLAEDHSREMQALKSELTKSQEELSQLKKGKPKAGSKDSEQVKAQHFREMQKMKMTSKQKLDAMKDKLDEERRRSSAEIEMLKKRLRGQEGDGVCTCKFARRPIARARDPTLPLDFNEVLEKILEEGMDALSFNEVALVHRRACCALQGIVMRYQKDTPMLELEPAVDDPCPHTPLLEADKQQLLSRIFALEKEINQKQKETQEAILSMELAIKKERCRLLDVKNLLQNEQRKNSQLKLLINSQTQFQSALRKERDELGSQAEFNQTMCEEKAKRLEEEMKSKRCLEIEVEKLKCKLKQLCMALDMERGSFDSRQRDKAEMMRTRLEEAMQNERRLQMQLENETKFRTQLQCQLQSLRQSFKQMVNLPEAKGSSINTFEEKSDKERKNLDQIIQNKNQKTKSKPVKKHKK